MERRRVGKHEEKEVQKREGRIEGPIVYERGERKKRGETGKEISD